LAPWPKLAFVRRITLEIHPAQADFLKSRANVTAEQIVPPEWCLSIFRCEDPGRRLGIHRSLQPLRKHGGCLRRNRDNASLTILRSIKIAPINALFDPNRASVCRNIATLKGKDLAGTHSRKDG
jgi:hypothetical protein